jgi:hypothetical protein
VKYVLRPDRDDDDWKEFTDALEQALGPELPGLCMGTHYFAERLLEARGFDVEASLAGYEKGGGYCDCEILFNVDPTTLEEKLEELTGE